LALSKLDLPAIAIDRDPAFQNRDEKIHILSARAVPPARQVDGSPKHMEIVSARLRAVEVFRFRSCAGRLRGTSCHVIQGVSMFLKKQQRYEIDQRGYGRFEAEMFCFELP
jgi:hypothetical protein